MKKKLFAVVIAAIASAMMLTACGSNSEATFNPGKAEGLEQIGFRLYRDTTSDVLWWSDGYYMEPRLNADGTLMTYEQYKQYEER